jgi:predicted alpha/beta-hydrolase family hydrolase
MAHNLADRKVATLRYQFPYTEAGKKAPNPQPVLLKTVRSAVAQGKKLARGIPVLAGGKSMGGRMTSLAASKEALDGVSGIVFLGFPLHAPGKSGSERAEHLLDVNVPMYFIQGSRDKLADLKLLKPVCRRLGKRSSLHVIDEGDHSFAVPKRTGKSAEDILNEVADLIAEWRP